MYVQGFKHDFPLRRGDRGQFGVCPICVLETGLGHRNKPYAFNGLFNPVYKNVVLVIIN